MLLGYSKAITNKQRLAAWNTICYQKRNNMRNLARPVLWMGLSLFTIVSSTAGQIFLADGDGKEAVERACSTCHSLATISAARHSRAEWENIVNNMVTVGFRADSDEELSVILDYLTRYYGVRDWYWIAYSTVSGISLFGIALWRYRYRRTKT